MATVSRGEITITNVDDGKPSYTHWAYAWSADGKDRFTTTYPGENLINLSTITLGKFVYWPGTGLTSNVSRAVTDYIPVKEGEQYTLSLSANDGFDFSFYLYKDNTSGISDLRYSGSAWQIPDTIGSTFGTPKTTLAIPTGYKYARVSFIKSSGTATAEVMKAIQPKMERGTVATPYAPAPSEDFENAYPTFAGSYVDDQPKDSEHPADYTWQRILGPGGKDGESAPLVSLSGATQAITVSKTGTVTPSSSFQVTGTAVNTTISTWTYSLNGGSFGSALPTGVTRSGNVVSVNPTTSTFDQLTIKADDGTVSDVFTISRITDGGDGNNGADAYTVFLTNESYTFAGSTSAALAGSTTTEVVVYKGINKITPTSITVGTRPTGLTSSVSGSVVTFTAATSLVTKSGTVPITIVADGKTFTKQFAYALSLQGGKGDTGDTGKGVAAEEISYSISQDGVNPPTSGWSGTRPTPKAGWYMWTRTRFKYTDNTYSAYFYLVAQQGKDAIIISDTAPANPTKGTLWQDSSVAPQIIKVFDGTAWSMWGMSLDNLLAPNILSENGVFKRLEGAEIVNTFSYTDSGVTYTGTTTMKDGNMTIARTGSDGSTWTTTMDRVKGFVDTYKASPTAPTRTTQLGQGKLFMVDANYGGYLPARALNPVDWANIPLSSGYVTRENATPQYRAIMRLDGSMALEIRGRCGPSAGFFTPGTGTKIGTLPAQYAPTRLAMFPVAFSGGFIGRIQIELNGDMMVQVNQESRNTVMLDGIVLPL